MARIWIFLSALILVGTVALLASNSNASVKAGPKAPILHKIGSFNQPVYITSAPNNSKRLFVVQQGGVIKVVDNGKTLSKPFLDIRNLVTASGEQGLLSMAFDPHYSKTGLFWVYYTDKAGRQRVVRYHRASATVASKGSARAVLIMQDPEANHNGGQLQFGPDGYLYIGTGDGGGGYDQHGAHGNAQNPHSLLGKLLRIKPTSHGKQSYLIPKGNPFRTKAGYKKEIYSLGLRNPWRFSFDRSTGALSIGDVGQDTTEEIDWVSRGGARGANFGWRYWEGTQQREQKSIHHLVLPVITHSHKSGFCSITGGYVVRDPGLPALRGWYVYADFCGNKIWTAQLKSKAATSVHQLMTGPSSISSFGQDSSGRIYVVSLNGGIWRLQAR